MAKISGVDFRIVQVNSKPQFLIAAGNSGSGKTTITLGLLRALQNRGINVQSFKVGPDFIDPLHHRHASGKTSINLDIFLAGEEGVVEEYGRYAKSADAVIVEGVMGLFDGSVRDTASSAHVAKLLGIPVIVVLDASSMAYTAAAILHGLTTFDSNLTIAGVIFNFCGSEWHAEMLRDAAESVGVKCLGCIPRTEMVSVKSRHLGLNYEAADEEVYSTMARLMEQHLDIDELLKHRSVFNHISISEPAKLGTLRIAVARDEAFCFTYEHNLRLFSELGEVLFFSPLHDSFCPAADLVYLPGGYPELFAEQLAANFSMKESLLALQREGVKIFGECGGLIYMGRTLITSDGEIHAMSALLPLETTMRGSGFALGYRRISRGEQVYYGHEFHYSSFSSKPECASSFCVEAAAGNRLDIPMVVQNGCFGSYIHFYFRSANDVKSLMGL